MATPAICQHHWVYETPNGPTCVGTCKHCQLSHVRSSSGDDEAGLWPAAMKAKRLKGGDVVKAKKGGARSVNQAQAFYGALR